MLLKSVAYIAIAVLFTSLMPLEPYMDEVFHVPQATLICQGDFSSWNAKITTFPGLYYVSCSLLSPLLLVQRRVTPALLRSANFALSLVLQPLYRLIVEETLGNRSTECDRLATLLFLFPLSSFYYNLYYTDSCSQLFLLLTYLLVLRARVNVQRQLSMISSFPRLLLASLSILMRQTNAVWLLFILGSDWAFQFEQHQRKQRRKMENNSFVILLADFIAWMWKNKLQLITSSLFLLLPLLGFLVFVVMNSGIVLGDKDNHKPTVHPAMFSHAICLSGLMLLPRLIAVTLASKFGHAKGFSRPTAGISWSVAALFGVICAVGLVHGSQSHPFLLSDNRHYTFYLWQRFLQHQHYRRLLSPIYCLCSAVFLRELSRAESRLWILIFLIAVALTLFPTPLLEPRYFTPTVVIGYLHCSKSFTVSKGDSKESTVVDDWIRVADYLTIIAFAVINAGLAYVYVHRSFVWPDGTIARFMF